jgi:hypothetical protein
MSSPAANFKKVLSEAAGIGYTYSRKRLSAFDAWQEHIRQSAASVSNAFAPRTDRDLRRAVVSG